MTLLRSQPTPFVRRANKQDNLPTPQPRSLGVFLIVTQKRASDHERIHCILASGNYTAHIITPGECVTKLLDDTRHYIVIADLPLLKCGNFGILETLQKLKRRVSILALLEYEVTDSVVKAMRLGAYGVLLKSAKANKVLEEADRVVTRSQLPNCEDPVLKYIQNNIGSIHSRDDVAAHFDISPETVSKRVKEKAQLSFSKYLERHRIDEAKRLLSYTKLNVNQIAGRVGFKSPQSFCRSFRHAEGCTSKEFRLQIRSTM